MLGPQMPLFASTKAGVTNLRQELALCPVGPNLYGARNNPA